MRSFGLLLGICALGCQAFSAEPRETTDAAVAQAVVAKASPAPSLSLVPAPRVEVTLPARADGFAEIASSGIRAKVRLIGAAGVEGTERGERVRFARAYAGADVEHVRTPIGAEDFVHFAQKPKEPVVRWSFTTSGVAGLRLVANTLELLDEGGMPRLRVPSPYVLDARGVRRTATLDVEGCAVDRDLRPAWGRALTAPAASCTLSVRWSDDQLAYPLTLDPLWSTTASLATARYGHTAVAVQAAGACSAGCVIVVGGLNSAVTGVPTPEIYNVASATWTVAPLGTGVDLASSGQSDIAGADATGGTALFLGGVADTAAGWRWDASTASWSTTTTPPSLRWFRHSMATFPGTGAFAAGGNNSYGASNPLNFWTKSTGKWAQTGASIGDGRTRPGLAVHQSSAGKVTTCAFGGGVSGGECVSLSTFSRKAFPEVSMIPTTVVTLGSLAYLTDGSGSLAWFDLAAASDALNLVCTSSCPPATGTIAGVKASAINDRGGAVLSDRLMFVGGHTLDSATGKYPASNVVDYLFPGATPTAATTSLVRTTGALPTARRDHTTTSLPNGLVLVAGGRTTDASTAVALSSAEVFALLAKGATCAASSDCGGGLPCVEGVCCDLGGASKTNCSDLCESCLVPGKVGTCSPRPARALPEVGHGSCPSPAGGACGYTCDGINRGTCAVAGTSASCASASCVDNPSGPSTFSATSTCDGAGACTLATPKTCGRYKCESATACRTTCTVNADCADGNKCAAGACVDAGTRGATCTVTSDCAPGLGLTCVDGVCCASASCPSGFSCAAGGGICKKPLGVACTDPNDCGSGSCVDGVCCESACGGQCQACDVPSSLGKCVAVAGAPHGTRAKCSDGGTDVCKALSCDGVDGTKCMAFTAGPAVECSRTCADEATVAVGSCDGTGGCGAAKNTSCAGFKCASGKCLTTCAGNAECASGYYCNPGTSRCEPALGKCSDDRSTSTSANGAVVTNCFPYLCDAGSGGCVKTCASTTSDCAPGQICGDGKCVPAPSDPGDEGGCTVGSPGRRSRTRVPPSADPRSQSRVPPSADPRSQSRVPPSADPRSAGLGLAILLVAAVVARRRRAA